MKPTCIFCPSPPTKHRGEHIFDDWLNRLEGEAIKGKYTFTQRDGDKVTRAYPTRKFDWTSPVICDRCNETWMSDLTNEMKFTSEGFIRYARPATLLPLGIVTLATFAFMKAAVVDAEKKTGVFSRPVRLRFKDTLEIPPGTQIWLAWFRSRRRGGPTVQTVATRITTGAFRGYILSVFTYTVGHLSIQLTYPKWPSTTLKRRPLPFLVQADHWDSASLPIWPNAPSSVEWPPPKYFEDDTLEQFGTRWLNIRSARYRPTI
jgi:hypothetical protein